VGMIALPHLGKTRIKQQVKKPWMSIIRDFHSGDSRYQSLSSSSPLFKEGGEPYGVKRLLRQFEVAASDDPERMLERINDELARFAEDRPSDDDQAMLLVVVE